MGEDKRQAIRLIVRKSLRVYIRSIGSNVKYELFSKNISHKGIGLESFVERKYPFDLNTLLDVWLQLDDQDNTVVSFCAKIVRSQDSDGKQSYGLSICQINDDQETKLHEYIESHIANLNDDKEEYSKVS